jgi:conjugal transfer pilus assembly protein TraU
MAGFSLDKLPWSAGCQGSMYPFSGTVSYHVGGLESALLLSQRILAKFHRLGLAWETSGKRALCSKKLKLVIKKSQYKTQLVFPKAHTNSSSACNPLGRTSALYGMGREFPYKGEDFAVLIWRKRNCCVL